MTRALEDYEVEAFKHTVEVIREYEADSIDDKLKYVRDFLLDEINDRQPKKIYDMPAFMIKDCAMYDLKCCLEKYLTSLFNITKKYESYEDIVEIVDNLHDMSAGLALEASDEIDLCASDEVS